MSETDRIQKKVFLRAPLARVWRAISDSNEFGAWFGMRFEGPFRAGQAIRGAVTPTVADDEAAKTQKPHEGLFVELFVDRIEPERLFSFRWHPFAIERDVDYSAEPTTLVTFELVEEKGGVTLTITESGFDRIPIARRAKAFAANEDGWEAQPKLLEKYLAKAS